LGARRLGRGITTNNLRVITDGDHSNNRGRAIIDATIGSGTIK